MDENGWSYYKSIDDAKADGYTVIKVWNVLQFFMLKGKATLLKADNLIPFPSLKYLCKGEGDHYFIREYRGYDLDTLFFYRPSLTFSGEDYAVDELRKRVKNGQIWLALTEEQTTEVKNMLERVKNSMINRGTLRYALFIELLHESIMYEDYKATSSNLTGYKTVCNIYEQKIKDLWRKAAGN
jgi:hypothetical protein